MRKGRRVSAPFPPPRFFECETMMNNMVLFNWKKMALRRELKTNFILEFPAYRSAFGMQAGRWESQDEMRFANNGYRLSVNNAQLVMNRIMDVMKEKNRIEKVI